MMVVGDVLSVWEGINAYKLTSSRQKSFLIRPEVVDLARFSREAVAAAGEAVYARDGSLRLQAWLLQVRHDVYERRGSRSGIASRDFLEASAAAMSSNPTVAETILWTELRAGVDGLRFACQVPMKGFILDFYCPAARVAVEVDGSSHRMGYAADARRDEYLRAERIVTLRFTNAQVLSELAGVLETIRLAVDTPDARSRQVKWQRRNLSRRPSTSQEVSGTEQTANRVSAKTAARAAVTTKVVKRAFRCTQCERTFVAPVQPVPRCQHHPGAKLIKLCVNRDQRAATVGDLCRACAEAQDL